MADFKRRPITETAGKYEPPLFSTLPVPGVEPQVLGESQQTGTPPVNKKQQQNTQPPKPSVPQKAVARRGAQATQSLGTAPNPAATNPPNPEVRMAESNMSMFPGISRPDVTGGAEGGTQVGQSFRSGGLMGHAGGLLGGGFGAGGPQEAPQTDILSTLMQLLGRMPGR